MLLLKTQFQPYPAFQISAMDLKHTLLNFAIFCCFSRSSSRELNRKEGLRLRPVSLYRILASQLEA